MTIWTPNIKKRPGPRYLAIAAALADDVENGRLTPGSRLPTQRDLAFRLGLTTGTIGRAYAEAQRLGFLTGEVGRGTFIRDMGKRLSTLAGRETPADHVIDISLNYPPAGGGEEDAFRDALAAVSRSNDLAPLLAYQHDGATPEQRLTAAAWLARAGIEARPEGIIFTAGLQHAMTVTLGAVCEPGDLVLAEALTYPGIRALSIMQHLRLQGIGIDEHGIVPDAFETACRNGPVRALYTIPTLQNPTASIMPLERREAIVDIARRHDVILVEDDIYGFMLPDAPPRLATLAPERTVYLTSTSKCLTPGLRVGFAVPPERLVGKLAAMVRTTLWMTAPTMIEIFRHLVDSGGADRIVDARNGEAAARQRIAANALGEAQYRADPMSPHLWLTLPQSWHGRDFVRQARDRGVVVLGADDFALVHDAGRDHVRLCLGCPTQRSDLLQAMAIVGDILGEGPDLYRSFA
jgi:DNA-binding transcriptional MocR family regulator